jgi:hypothetical protein
VPSCTGLDEIADAAEELVARVEELGDPGVRDVEGPMAASDTSTGDPSASLAAEMQRVHSSIPRPLHASAVAVNVAVSECRKSALARDKTA